MAAAAPADALGRALALLDDGVRDRAADFSHGYLDLLGDGAPESTGATQDLMLTRAVPLVYERWWRPALGRLAKGLTGPSMSEEHRIARLLLALAPGDGVLDVACGPGNFTREFARIVGAAGLAVGIDASATMLRRAVRHGGAGGPHMSAGGGAPTPIPAGEVAYVRGDAVVLPFRDASFDAVCCFAALHLFAEPFVALDHMTRVLTPGGRIAILTSCRTRSAPARAIDGLLGRRSGMRMFEQDEIVEALRERGFTAIRQRIGGLAQFVGARFPS